MDKDRINSVSASSALLFLILSITYFSIMAFGFFALRSAQLTLMDCILNVLPFAAFAAIDFTSRKRKSSEDVIRILFHMYIVIVAYLTVLYFPVINSKLLSVYDLDFQSLERFNLVPFKIYRIYDLFDKQILGNLLMLVPMGVFLFTLYDRKKSKYYGLVWIPVIAVAIELIQFVLSNLVDAPGYFYTRSTDIDDFILNTAGGIVGYISSYVIYRLYKRKGKKKA